MAAEVRLRPDAVEAVEDRLARFLRHARAFVLDAIITSLADRRGADLDQPARRREGDGIVDDIVEQPRQPRFVAEDDRACPARGRAKAIRTSPSRRGLPRSAAGFDQHCRDRPARSGRATARRRAATPRRCRRSAGRAGRRPRAPRRSAGAQRRILDPVEAVDRRAQRGEGVLELVGDVGGEGLGRVDPLAQRLGHVVQARGRAGRSRRAARAGAAPRPRARGRAGPDARRARAGAAEGDGAGEEQRQQDREDQRDEQDDSEREALGADLTRRMSRALRVRSSTRPSPASAHRGGDERRCPPARGGARLRRAAAPGAPPRFGPGLEPGRRRAEQRRRLGAPTIASKPLSSSARRRVQGSSVGSRSS